jgi:hypothetical protein
MKERRDPTLERVEIGVATRADGPIKESMRSSLSKEVTYRARRKGRCKPIAERKGHRKNFWVQLVMKAVPCRERNRYRTPVAVKERIIEPS